MAKKKRCSRNKTWSTTPSPSWDVMTPVGSINARVALVNGQIVFTENDISCGDDYELYIDQAHAIYNALGNCLRAAKKIKRQWKSYYPF